MARILIADDEEVIRSVLRRFLATQGHEVLEAGNGREALALCRDAPPDLAFLDMFMPDMDGIETLMALRREAPATPVIAMSGGGNIHRTEILEDAEMLGAAALLQKPFELAEVRGLVTRLLDRT